MLKNYYLSQLYKHTDQPTLTFAFRGTINWMRALAIVCEETISYIKPLRCGGNVGGELASFYCSQKVKKTRWESYVEDLEQNLRFEFDMSILECR